MTLLEPRGAGSQSPKRRKLLRMGIGLACLGVAMAALAPLGFALGQGAEEIAPRFGIRPVDSGAVSQDTGTFFNYALAPGESISDEALVINMGDSPITLELYAADGVTSVNGGVTYTRPGEPGKGVRHWLSTNVSQVTLEPEETLTVPFTLNVPVGVDNGDWVAGLVVEAPPRPGAEGIALNVVERVGVAVVVHVPGSPTQTLTLNNACYNGADGSNYFQMTVTNPGNVLSRGSGSFTLASQTEEEVVFEQAADLGSVIPGDETLLRIEPPMRPSPGDYVATTVLEQPNGQHAANRSSIKIDDGGSNGCQAVADVAGEEQEREPAIAGLPGGGFPWLILLLAILAALIVAAAAREYLRRRRARAAPPTP